MKRTAPYLVDIGLGDYCPYGCSFCYTSSTTKGKFANLEEINHICNVLHDIGVFEVVFGGGEPTLYFDSQNHTIVDVLKLFRAKDIITGLTTKNYNIHKHKHFNSIFEQLNTIAFSCNTIEELHKIKACTEQINNISTTRVYVQNILGLDSQEKLIKWCLEAKSLGFTDITFLGYKSFGFGKLKNNILAPNQITEEFIVFLKNLNINIGFDSIAVKQYKKSLLNLGVPEYCLVGREGESTCYIEASKNKLQPSSFTEKYVDFNKSHDTQYFLKHFAEF